MKKQIGIVIIIVSGLMLTACGGNDNQQDLAGSELVKEAMVSEEDAQKLTVEEEKEADSAWGLEDFTSHSKDEEYLKTTTEDYSIHETTMSEDGGILQQRWYSYDEQGNIVYACEKTVFETETEAEELYQFQMQNYADGVKGKLFQEGEILYRLHDMKLEAIINYTDKKTEWEEYKLLAGTPGAEYEKYYFSSPLNR